MRRARRVRRWLRRWLHCLAGAAVVDKRARVWIRNKVFDCTCVWIRRFGLHIVLLHCLKGEIGAAWQACPRMIGTATRK